jgi:hypothetical protein
MSGPPTHLVAIDVIVLQHQIITVSCAKGTASILLSEALAACGYDKLMGILLRLLLTENVDFRVRSKRIGLTKADTVFPKAKERKRGKTQRPAAVKVAPARVAAKKKAG